MTDDLNELAILWLDAKENEATWIDRRRKIEDRIKSLAGVSENLEGTETLSPDFYTIKIVGRLDRKVDADKLQNIAIEHGLTEHLSTLFRWKPEVNMGIWKQTNESITKPLTEAITLKPGRPSVQIIEKEQRHG